MVTISRHKNDLVCLDNQKITTFSPGFRVERVKKKGAFRPFCNIFYQNKKKMKGHVSCCCERFKENVV